MDKRVYLHVGVHRSGTHHLQTQLFRHRAALREVGVLYPGAGSTMFLAAVDVRGTHRGWGLRAREVRGQWDQLCRSARVHDGATVLSHELFAAAAPRQVVAAMTMLRGLDVHLVVSTADAANPATVDAVSRWGRAVEPDHLHLLTGAPGPAGHDALWRGLADVVGFDPVEVTRARQLATD
jgi:hypothetical protein